MVLNAGQIKVFVFDAYGTLFDVHSPALSLATELGVDAASFSALWRAKQLEYTWLRSLMGEYAPFDQVTADALDYALQTYAIENPALRDKLLALYLTLAAYDDAGEALRGLQAADYPTALLSNGSPGMLAAAVTSAGFESVLTKVLSVDSVGIYKPSPRVYQLAVDAFGLSAPSQVAFVSANGWDCAGAARFGFQVIHVNRFGQQAERLGHPPAEIVASLRELPHLIQGST